MDRIPVPPQLADRVYRAILDAICDGRLAPGERVTQDDLAARLDVSRQPILQALVLLKNQGFVRDAGRRGVVVAPLDPAFVGHLYDLRAVLDGAAARSAARRGAPEAARRGPALIEAGRAAVDAGDVAAMVVADMNFHLFLYELSGNPLIAQTASLHWQHIRRAMGGYLRDDGARARVWDDHEAILNAVAAGDGDGAERLSRTHAAQSGAKLVAALSRIVPAAPPGREPAQAMRLGA